MRQLRTGKSEDRGPVWFVLVFVLRSLPPDEKGLDARAFGGPVLGVGGVQKEQGRTLQVCLSSSHTIYVRFHLSLYRCSDAADPGADR